MALLKLKCGCEYASDTSGGFNLTLTCKEHNRRAVPVVKRGPDTEKTSHKMHVYDDYN